MKIMMLSFHDALTATISAILNVIVMCPFHMPAEHKIDMFHYCEEVINILRKLENLREVYHCC